MKADGGLAAFQRVGSSGDTVEYVLLYIAWGNFVL
jgi:hypothetical protein